MRWVLDTNVMVSALIWQGTPRTLLTQGFAAGVQFHTSPELLAELQATLHAPKLVQVQRARRLQPDALLVTASTLMRSIPSPPLPKRFSRDPDDDAVLACALAAKATLIVSSDKDLLVLEHFRDIPIVTAAQALTRLQRPDSP